MKAKFDEARKGEHMNTKKDDVVSEEKSVEEYSGVKVGDRIIYEYRYCTIVDKRTENGKSLLVIRYDSGSTETIENDLAKYTITTSSKP